MARRPRGQKPKSIPRSGALVAAGTKIDVSDSTALARYKRRSSKDYWQERASVYDEEIPEIGFAHDYVRDSLSRVRIFPAILSDEPDAPPLPLNRDTAPDGLDPELADSILQRLEPFSDFMGQAARKIDVSGECHVALVPDDDEIDGERCRVLSSEELIVRNEEWVIRLDESDSQGTPLPSEAVLFRIHQPSGRFWDLPTSPMRRLLGVCDELLLLTRVIEGMANSRIAINGGLLFIGDELSLESATHEGSASTEDAGDGEGRADTFIDDFMVAAQAAISDPTSAAAMLRIIVRGPSNMVDAIKAIDLDRPFDEVCIKIRAELLGRMGNGINLPREIVLGVGSTNHWNDESIRKDTWKIHLEPRAMNITSATTAAFYRPQLLDNDIDPDIVRRCVIGYDPVWFIGTPDLSESADYGYDNYLLSGEAWRQAKGHAEDSRPSEEEVRFRLWIKQQERLTIRETTVAPPGEDQSQPEPAGVAETAGVDETLVNSDTPQIDVPTGDDKTKPDALVAAAHATELDLLGARLVGIERLLRTKLQAIANGIVARALERAGLKVRNKLNGRAAAAEIARREPLVDAIRDLAAAEIPAALGRPTVVALGLKEDALLAGALGDLEAHYRTLVRRSQLAAARAAAQATGDDFDDDQFDAQMGPHRDAGWALLAAGITALVAGLLYDPHPSAPEHGEFDDTSVVTPGLIRAALDAAGGANVDTTNRSTPVQAADARPTGGGATAGPAVLDDFKAQLGIVDDRYTWLYGDAPRTPFEPHLALDGTSFTAWDDPVLANSDRFPDQAFYAPADHDGCLCDFAVSFSQAGEEATP